ncbi:CCAAT-box-binding transcription factor [Drechmeria coniospora]|uniref:CCAAT-box-binding transcription factor n=1 Tax=Drechmeria coniospora TaxID=98403 RepID=A0A151GFS5_DRECN|nr:CCAAT-box-binding transcription factor [Drechmeria coniospora]KYK55957.1 CCAAT-box-binding transcription factor [Drechmeria coniospora]
MPKSSSRARAPRTSDVAPEFDVNALAHLTSSLNKSLGTTQHKRKGPPTNGSNQQHSKKQRPSVASPQRESSGDNLKDQGALLAEIKELGGDEEDLELINEVDSDDSDYAAEPARPIDKTLKMELAALSKELGFADIVPEEASDVDMDESAEAGDEVGDVEEEEDDDDSNQEDIAPSRKPGGMAKWHSAGLKSLPGPTTEQLGPFMGAVESLKNHARELLEQDAAKYRTSIFASSSHKFLSTIMSSGTLTDKVSALTLAIQESPVHNIRATDALIALASKKSRAQAIGAIGALVDLLGPGTLLPSDRRLRPFHSQPGLLGTLQKTSVRSWNPSQPLPGKVTGAHLIAWMYEDWLKETYFKIIQLLEAWCSDEIEYSRVKAVDFVYGLLKEKPEQESNLLTLLVNKLGDRDRKIASRASYLLLQLQVSHPGMKPIIIRSVEQDILLHPSQDTRSKYYAINTLNQTILSSKEPAVAESLIRIYFDFFVSLLKTGNLGFGDLADMANSNGADVASGKPKGPDGRPTGGRCGRRSGAPKPTVPETEAADKLVSAILTGVNRAAPFVGVNDAIMDHHLDTLFKIAHSANFNTSIQALLLIQHLSSTKHFAMDRFFRALYESLLDPRLVTSSKQSLYLNLLLRSLKSDVDVRRVKAFAKRMLQIAGLHQPPFICGLLYVISQLQRTFPDLSNLVEDPETSVFDDETSKNQPTYDGRKRDPEHSNAQRSCLWEMVPVQTHFHPSVSVFADALLDRGRDMPKPDLESHTLIRFLDKFVYRNPKSTDSARGASIMQPLRTTKDSGDIWLGGRSASASAVSVNSAAFWNKKIESVAAEDVFFHEYFQHIPKEPAGKKAKQSVAEDGENGEDEIWEALVSEQPGIDIDDEDSGSLDGLDDLDMLSDDGSSLAFSLESDMEDFDEDQIAGTSDGGSGSDGEETKEKEKEEGKDKKVSRRKMLKSLPMFASVDDYAEMLAEEDGM